MTRLNRLRVSLALWLLPKANKLDGMTITINVGTYISVDLMVLRNVKVVARRHDSPTREAITRTPGRWLSDYAEKKAMAHGGTGAARGSNEEER